jgi:RNA polymerase sigma factor (sigma-70 family)
MVMGVCRRLVRDAHDAEDAFQATFLVLVRKAASVVPREMVANWLYGVARMTALRASALKAKRRKRERQMRDMPEPERAQPELWLDLQPLLDRELAQLPDKYRVAIVLCDLEGKSHKEAARQLGWPQGTLSGRLARARKLLANRLARHGVIASGGVLTGVLSQNASSASVPISLVSSTLKAASLLAAGQTAGAGLISAKAATLMEGVVIAMLLNKLKVVTMVLMVAAMVGGAGLLYGTQAAEQADEAPRLAASQTEQDEFPSDSGAKRDRLEPSNRNLLSSNPMPRPALVSLSKGQIIVRTLDVVAEPTSVLFQGQPYTTYQKAEILRTQHYKTEMVKVYDVHGKSIPRKELPRLLQKETVALVSSDEYAADPLNLRLFKEGTLLFVLPAPPSVVPAQPAMTPAPGVIYVPAAPPWNSGRPVLPPPTVGGSASLPPPPAPAAPPIAVGKADPAPLEIHGRVLRVPIMVQPEFRAAMHHLDLLASCDEGKSWEKVETIAPDADSFVFLAPRDGLYWLVIRTIGRDGKAQPADLTGGTVRPQLKVLVNTGEGEKTQKAEDTKRLDGAKEAWGLRRKEY